MPDRPLTASERADMAERGYQVPEGLKVKVCPPRTFSGDEAVDFRSQARRSWIFAKSRERAKAKAQERGAERLAQYDRLFKAGCSPDEVADRLGVSRGTVLGNAKRLGIAVPHRGVTAPMTEDELRAMEAKRAQGWSYRRIADWATRDPKTVYRRLTARAEERAAEET